MFASLTNTAKCFYRALMDTVNHDGIEHAGYLAFLGLLSLFPFLVLIFAIAGVIGEQDIGVQFVTLVLPRLPEDVAQALEPRINEIISGPPQGLMTISIVGAIWTASSMVEGLRTILNRAYRVTTPPIYPLRRLLSIGQFLIITLLVIIGMLIAIFWPLLIAKVNSFAAIGQRGLIEVLDPFWSYVSYGVSALVLLLMIAAIYYVLPNIRQRFLRVLPGALFTVFGWFCAAMLLSAYLSDFDQVNIIYGSLGGIIAALLFFYLLAGVMILGAEFNYHLEVSRGHAIVQREEAENLEFKF
ncbi:MAG: YihY/virulence factor BrkB family protein [Alphaproteobacteria bacterium]|nr:YihY/virulence factor BrkB family protein [Alphaproteobacteria bacterium]